MAANSANSSYYVPAHLESAGPFNTVGSNGYNVEHLRDFNNAAPLSAFGFETQAGHGASASRGEYTIRRNNFSGTNVDSVGGTTYGGTGVYGAQIGGVWDALLGEGRGYFFFSSSDWHNRGTFGPDDRRSTQDFFPGEYQRDYVMVRNGSDKIRPQAIVDGLRSGNSFAASGQLIDRLSFIACASYAGPTARSNTAVENLAVSAINNNTDINVSGCATMGQKLTVRPGADIVVAIVVRDPSGTNYSPYSFPNPSLAQVSINQPLNTPILDHVDLISGLVSGYADPSNTSVYAGEWPRNWLALSGTVANNNLTATPGSLSSVPAAAKNTSAAVIKTFINGSSGWTSAGTDTWKMSYRIPAVLASQYVRLRGSNLPVSVPYETDRNGNPLPDLYTNAAAVSATTSSSNDGYAANAWLKIPCNTTGSNVPANTIANNGQWTQSNGTIDGCPNHLPVVNNQKMVAYDVAAWSDLWFYSNPIFVQVNGSTVVAGIN